VATIPADEPVARAAVEARFTGRHTETPLRWAASSDDVEVLDALIERGADRDWIGYDELTPLDTARRSGADALVEWLRQQGARTAAEVRK
jgi:ankyrin repeat protein